MYVYTLCTDLYVDRWNSTDTRLPFLGCCRFLAQAQSSAHFCPPAFLGLWKRWPCHRPDVFVVPCSWPCAFSACGVLDGKVAIFPHIRGWLGEVGMFFDGWLVQWDDRYRIWDAKTKEFTCLSHVSPYMPCGRGKIMLAPCQKKMLRCDAFRQ